jgi:hypothetical protein
LYLLIASSDGMRIVTSEHLVIGAEAVRKLRDFILPFPAATRIILVARGIRFLSAKI